jgi:hypothetical protein
MAKKPEGPKPAVDQTNQDSLKAHSVALKDGRSRTGVGIILRHEDKRQPGESPGIVLKDVHYADLCDIGKNYLAYKWIAPAVAAVAGGPRDCEGRSCARTACSGICICDPVTQRCVKFDV